MQRCRTFSLSKVDSESSEFTELPSREIGEFGGKTTIPDAVPGSTITGSFSAG